MVPDSELEEPDKAGAQPGRTHHRRQSIGVHAVWTSPVLGSVDCAGHRYLNTPDFSVS